MTALPLLEGLHLLLQRAHLTLQFLQKGRGFHRWLSLGMQGRVGVQEGGGRRVEIHRCCVLSQVTYCWNRGYTWLRLSDNDLEGIHPLFNLINIQCDLLTELIDLFLQCFIPIWTPSPFQLLLQTHRLLKRYVASLDAFLYVSLDRCLFLLPVLLKLLLKLTYPGQAGDSLLGQGRIVLQTIQSEGQGGKGLLQGALEVQGLEGWETR